MLVKGYLLAKINKITKKINFYLFYVFFRYLTPKIELNYHFMKNKFLKYNILLTIIL